MKMRGKNEFKKFVCRVADTQKFNKNSVIFTENFVAAYSLFAAKCLKSLSEKLVLSVCLRFFFNVTFS